MVVPMPLDKALPKSPQAEIQWKQDLDPEPATFAFMPARPGGIGGTVRAAMKKRPLARSKASTARKVAKVSRQELQRDRHEPMNDVNFEADAAEDPTAMDMDQGSGMVCESQVMWS